MLEGTRDKGNDDGEGLEAGADEGGLLCLIEAPPPPPAPGKPPPVLARREERVGRRVAVPGCRP